MSDRLPPARRRVTAHRRWTVVPALLALVGALPPALSVPALAAGGAAGRAYVGNDGTVSVLDVAKHVVVATIPAAYGIRDVAVDAAGTRVYTADYGMAPTR
ncbi:hypothetical protein [Nonomuraea typhae]|uniref:YncE family protein n=1 Tax=Nonomuraea typhae TaxID=2603600 RepID=A0ABW7YPX9_9ACTN